MAQTFAPYMTLMNDPALSKTGGKWFADTVPGYTDKSQSQTGIDGHFLAVSKYAKNPDWSIEFIRMACSKQWQLRSIEERGNAPPRGSVLNDPAMAEKLGWPPTAARAIETGFPTPGHPTWSALRAGAPHRRIRNFPGPENRKAGARRGGRRLAAHPAPRRCRARLKGSGICKHHGTNYCYASSGLHESIERRLSGLEIGDVEAFGKAVIDGR